jgi:hypothetical protein
MGDAGRDQQRARPRRIKGHGEMGPFGGGSHPKVMNRREQRPGRGDPQIPLPPMEMHPTDRAGAADRKVGLNERRHARQRRLPERLEEGPAFVRPEVEIQDTDAVDGAGGQGVCVIAGADTASRGSPSPPPIASTPPSALTMSANA